MILQVCEEKPVQKCETVTTPMEYEVPVEKCEEEEEDSSFDLNPFWKEAQKVPGLA